RPLVRLRLPRIHDPQLVLAVIVLKYFVVAVLLLPILLALAFRARRRKRNLLPIFRPVKSTDVRLLLRQLPRLSAFRRDHPSLVLRRFSFSLFLLLLPFFLFRS